ncbi:MAG: DUF2800 domain-containing protein, partial [Limnohabitans sp.]
MLHSSIVGGSTAKRVINCPGSVALVNKMPPKPSSEFADRGTLLHDVISEILGKDLPGHTFIGTKYNDQVLTEDLYVEKIETALQALDEIDPKRELVYEVETRVGFGDLLPGVFGSTDLVGRLGDRAVVLDWKFGDGVVVDAEENPQLMFYAAACMRTPEAAWAFDGVEDVELIIVQPPVTRRWMTTKTRIKQFEQELVLAVHESQKPDAKLQHGEHCRWCAAKPICPKMTGAVDRALKTQLDQVDLPTLGRYLQNADLLEQWINDLRGLAKQMLDSGKSVPGYKLVNKRSTRQWVNEQEAIAQLHDMGLTRDELYKPEELSSPAQIEKVLKKRKMALPDDLVVAVSSGTTMAPESDPRPAVVQIGATLVAALSKLQ